MESVAVTNITIHLHDIEVGLQLRIDGKENTLFDAINSADENNEARFQLMEGCFYDYTLNNENYRLGDIGENIIRSHKGNKSLGSITPNIFVGTLEIPLINAKNDEKVKTIYIEVQSTKMDYRDDYRNMLQFITEKSTELLLQANSPIIHYFDIDYTQDSQTLYQQFAFLKSVIDTNEFAESIHQIVISPVTKWSEVTEYKDIRKTKRFSNNNIKELLKGGRRISLHNLNLRHVNVSSLPEKISVTQKKDSIDTPDNRFVKYVLESFLKFCTEIHQYAIKLKHHKMILESKSLIEKLEMFLQHNMFAEVRRPTILTLNSPILQRKVGYREVLRVWSMWELTLQLRWSGGDDVYGGRKKDVATLYEYWIFFKLLDLFTEIFTIKASDIASLIQETKHGLQLQIKQGKFSALHGVYDNGGRKLNIRFNYNRSFIGGKKYPLGGSWTRTMRPDYTLSFWEHGLSEEEAEKQELIVHIHFDAKYKIANKKTPLDTNDSTNLDTEKNEYQKGIYKSIDLLKMLAYKDTIRRTVGAYILYPGDIPKIWREYKEIIPGIGAFPMRPSKSDSGISELKSFIKELISHLCYRNSQRQRMADSRYQIYNDQFIVLVGDCKSQLDEEWIQKNQKYVFNLGSGDESRLLTKEMTHAEYLLFPTQGKKPSGRLWKIKKGPRIFLQKDLEQIGYPSPEKDYYFVIDIEPLIDEELKDKTWNINTLRGDKEIAFPFAIDSTELMNHIK